MKDKQNTDGYIIMITLIILAIVIALELLEVF